MALKVDIMIKCVGEMSWDVNHTGIIYFDIKYLVYHSRGASFTREINGPCTKLVFLGVKIDTSTMMLSLPATKLNRHWWEPLRFCTKIGQFVTCLLYDPIWNIIPQENN